MTFSKSPAYEIILSLGKDANVIIELSSMPKNTNCVQGITVFCGAIGMPSSAASSRNFVR